MKSIARSLWAKPLWAKLLATMVAAVALFVYLVYLAYIDWPGRPDPLPKDLQHAVGDRAGLVRGVYVYDFWGNFIDQHHLWRIETDPGLVDLLAERLRLEEVPLVAVPGSFWRQPPHWWRPGRGTEAKFFMSPRFIADGRGPDGDHYLLMYDGQESVIYAWVKNNF